jgi:hypothetical protein
MTTIYIANLPKDKLLYELWLNARSSPYFLYCKDKLPKLTIEQVRKDINEMLKNGHSVYLNSYYGKTMYIDISGDIFDTADYSAYNRVSCEKIINIVNRLKLEELNKFILKYFIYW